MLAFESVVKVCRDNKIPLFAADVDSVGRGAIGALAVDYYKMGRQTEQWLAGSWMAKRKISEMPVEFQKELLLYLNPRMAEQMGVRLPDALVKEAAKIIQ